MLFTFVRVHGGFAAHRGIEFLEIGGGSFDDCAVRLANASVNDFQRLEFGGKRVNEQSKLVDGGFGLNTHPEDEVSIALAVWLETYRALNQLIDVGFFVIRFVMGMLRGSRGGSGGNGRRLCLRERRRKKVECQKETSQKRNAHSVLSFFRRTKSTW